MSDTTAPHGALQFTPVFGTSTSNPYGLDEVGYSSRPSFVDIDGDGDLDAVVGNGNGDTQVFLNTGTASSPAFALATTNPYGLSNVGNLANPSFVDIDGDGDLDGLIGNFDGNTLVYLNTGTASSPAFAAAITNLYDLGDVGEIARPSLVDIDGDGDRDALIGERLGNTLVFLNTGTASSPAFAAAITNLYGLDNVGAWASPSFVDIDGDGDLDALIGNFDGNTLVYLNTGTASSPAFAAFTPNPYGLGDVGYYASPSFVDIDGDGDLDAVTGNQNGDLWVFINSANPVAPVTSPTPDGAYGVGSVITLHVAFSEDLTVDTTGGNPTLKLAIGAMDRYAVYDSGSGTGTLTFIYTVQAGDTAADLDIFSSSALELNGATIQDAAGNNAILTLATPGGAGSLAAASDIVIDGIAPHGTVLAPLFFGEPVSGAYGLSGGTGNPNLALADIDGDGDLDAFIGDKNGVSLYLNTGTATGPAFDAVPQASPFGLNPAGNILAPVLADIDGDGDLDAFIGNKGNTEVYLNTGSSTSPAFDLPSTNPYGLEVSDNTFGATPSLGDIDGDGDLDAFIGTKSGDVQVYLNTGTALSPSFESPVLDPYGLLHGGSFAKFRFVDIDADGDLDAVVLDGSGITVQLNTGTALAPAFGPQILNPFGLPSTNVTSIVLADIDGDGDLDAVILDGSGSARVQLNSATLVARVTTPMADGAHAPGDLITLEVEFSENVLVDTSASSPLLQLATGGGSGRYAEFTGGSGTSTLTFTYTVQAGDSTADLDVSDVRALVLNGSSIKDAAGNDAVLYVASAGIAGSLSDNATLVLDGVPPVLTISSDLSHVKAGEVATIIFTFDDTPVGFDFSDLSVTGGALSNFSAVFGNPKVYTADFTPDAGTEGTLNIDIAAGAFADAVGNQSLQTGFGLSYDTIAPLAPSTPDLAFYDDHGVSDSDNITNIVNPWLEGTAEANTSITFYDTTGGVTAEVGSTGVDGSGNWTYQPYLGEGLHSITAKVTDAAGNDSPLTAALEVTIDTTAPTVTITSNAPHGEVLSTAVFTFTFSEPPVDFDLADVYVSVGTLNGFTVTGDPLVYNAIYTPPADYVGSEYVFIDGYSYTDIAGNTGYNGNYGFDIDSVVYNSPAVMSDSTSGRQLVNLSGTVSLGGMGSLDFARTMAVQADGKILMGGNSEYHGVDFGLVRLNADGSLDHSFGDGGVVVTDVGDEDSIYALAQQSDGKIIAAGVSADGSDSRVVVARYNTDGTLDRTFGHLGTVSTQPGSGVFSEGASVAIQTDGKILVAGYSDDDLGTSSFMVLRYNSDGSLDDDFGTSGVVLTDFSFIPGGSGTDAAGFSMALQSDGSILVAGVSDVHGEDDVAIVRYLADGTLDTSFGPDGNGAVVIDAGLLQDDAAYSVALQSDGKIVVAGYTSDGSGEDDFLVMRFNGDGTLDTDFSDDGIFTLDLGGFDEAHHVTIQPDGKILVTGSAQITGNPNQQIGALVRLTTDGSLDSSFGTGGVLLQNQGLYVDAAASAVLADGTILTVGSASTVSDVDFQLAVYHDNGTPDTSIAPQQSLSNNIDYTEGAPPIVLAPGLRIRDAELSALNGGFGNYDGSGIALVSSDAGTVFGATGALSFSNGNVILSGVTIGVVDSYPGLLQLLFNANATQASVDEAVKLLTYFSGGEDTLTVVGWVFIDGNLDDEQGAGGPGITFGSTTIHTTPVNDVPEFNPFPLHEQPLQVGLAAVIDGLQVYDADPGATGHGDVLHLTLLAHNGVISGLVDEDAGTAGIQISGYADDINDALALASFEAAAQGMTSIDLTLGDGTAPDVTAALGFNVVAGVVRTGTSGNDTLLGTAAGDALLGLDGNDRLSADAGNDILEGGEGDDLINGGAGDDSMRGGAGDDIYYVNSAGDEVEENLSGSAGGSDTVYSFISDYTLTDNVERGRIYASGAANMTGNALGNRIYAGNGNNVMNGAGGTDKVSYEYATAGVAVSLAITGSQNTLGSGLDTLISIEQVTGSDFNDTLTGNSGDNYLGGGNGNDTLSGGSGHDNLAGGAGNDSIIGGGNGDTMNGGAGADTLIGGTGSDEYYVDNVGDVVVETATGGGADTVYSSLASYTLGAYIERGGIIATGSADMTGNSMGNRIYAGDGDNVIDGAGGNDMVSYANASGGVTVSLNLLGFSQDTGSSGFDTLISIEKLAGSKYDDALAGGSGADSIEGGAGKDLLFGDAGNDTLNGGSGADTMVGGTGDDSYYVDNLDDVVVEQAGGGTDTVYSYLSSYTLGDYIDRGSILATGAADMTGNASGNRIYAGAGNNVIDGGGGTDKVAYDNATGGVSVNLGDATSQNTISSGWDTLISIEQLTGSVFNDTLVGSAGDNYLAGGAGDDLIVGGDGNDALSGGAGADVFAFAAGSGTDVISDFKVSQGDVISIVSGVNGSDIVDAASAMAHLSEFGGNAVMDFGGGNMVTLTGVHMTDLTAASFTIF